MKTHAPHLVLAVMVVAGVAACEPAESASVVGSTRVSADSAGGDANGESASPSISTDGRYVAFESVATDLTPEGQPGVFVRDRVTATTTRVDEGASPSISGDGRSVAYVRSDGSVNDVFVRDLGTGTTTLVSVGADGSPAGSSYRPSISADGRHVAFVSTADGVVAGDEGAGQPDVFVRHLDSGVTERANVSLAGGDSNSAEYGASRYSETSSVISADGRYVTFQSFAEDLVPGGTDLGSDIFVRDLVADVTVLASDVPEVKVVFAPTISADGGTVAYINSEFGAINGGDVLVRDLVTGTTTKANLDTGQPASFSFFAPSLSADGRLVSFESSTINDLPDNTPVDGDAYVRDLVAGTTSQVSVDAAGGAPDGASFLPELSGDGGSVAYVSEATDLVPGDTNGLRDIFVTDLADDDVHDRLVALRDLVAGFDLPRGIENSLTVKVKGAIEAFDADDTETACTRLTALANQARAQSGKKLSTDQATRIITESARIRDLLGCNRP